MVGRGQTAGWDRLMVSAPGASGILTSVSRTSIMKRPNGACQVGGGASLMGVAVSPTVSTRGGSGGRESKLNVGLLQQDNNTSCEGGNVLGVQGANQRSGLLGFPRIVARVKVPGRENRSRFVLQDCLPDIWEEFLFILKGGTAEGARGSLVAQRWGRGPRYTRGCCLLGTTGCGP